MAHLPLDHLLRRRGEDEEEEEEEEGILRNKAMYHSNKPQHSDFYKEELMIDAAGDSSDGGGQHSPGEEYELRAPKKRAETWVQEETRSLIGLRREMDGMFNTSKSNKLLWEQISAKMRDRGFDRSPTMCPDKWRNLLKEYKKAKQQYRGSGGESAKMSYYKQLEELLRERNTSASPGYKAQTTVVTAAAAVGKVECYLQFNDKGLEDAGIPYGTLEGTDRSSVNLERRVDHDAHHLAITTADAPAGNGLPPWNWRDALANGWDFDWNHLTERICC